MRQIQKLDDVWRKLDVQKNDAGSVLVIGPINDTNGLRWASRTSWIEASRPTKSWWTCARRPVPQAREEGKRCAQSFLDAHRGDLGERSTLDLDALLEQV